MPNINCPVCGKVFFRGPKQLAKSKAQPTCSWQCSIESNPPKGRTPNYKCVVCGKLHYQRPSAIEKTKRGLTCSKECGKINRSGAMMGSANHQYGIKGPNNASWNAETRKLNTDGYWIIYAPDHPRSNSCGYFLEHVILLEKKIGRHLIFYKKGDKRNEVCHHKDGDKQNNDLDNLQLMTHSEHSTLHNKLSNRQRDLKGQFK